MNEPPLPHLALFASKDPRAQIVVVGSGPGGAITACLLAEGGRDVLLVEEGPHLPLSSCAPFSRGEMVQKYRNGGVSVALGRPKVAYVEGRCVGGGSEINSGLYHRPPPDALERWRRELGVEALSPEDLRPHLEACERDLQVSLLPGPAPPASLRLHDGARALGWRSMEVPRWFRYGPGGGGESSGGVRQSMTETYIPRGIAAGCRLLPDTKVLRLRRHGSDWELEAVHTPAGEGPRRICIRAETVFVAAGALQTPLILRRSGVRRGVGDRLKMHATAKVVARFSDPVNGPGAGVPPHQVKEFAPRWSFGCSISSLPHLALALVDYPRRARGLRDRWREMAAYYAMIGGGTGKVRTVPFHRDCRVSFRLGRGDLCDLADALRGLCRLLLAAGAVELLPGITGLAPIRTEADVGRIPRPLPALGTNLMTIHLMASVPMGEKRGTCPVDSFGRVRDVPGLHVADASLLGGAPGVNPQGTIMGIVRRNALRFLGEI